jgi:chemotaxis signal transduction protein
LEEFDVGMKKNYFIATLGKVNIGFPITSIFGVYPMSSITSIPNAPEHILGLAIIQQKAVPIVCLNPPKADSADLILILENNQDRFGLVVEQAKGICEIPAKEIKACLEHIPALPQAVADYALGVWANGGEPVWLLNPEKMVLVSQDDIKINNKMEDKSA